MYIFIYKGTPLSSVMGPQKPSYVTAYVFKS